MSTRGRPLCNLRFADIDVLGSSEEELQQHIERLEKTAAGYGIEISSDKSKILVNSIKPWPTTNIWMNGKALEQWNKFKYIGSTQTKDGTSIKEVIIRLAQVPFRHDKASNTMEKQRLQFSYKDQTLQVTSLVNTAL